jgi:hypothetical protein
VLKERFTPKNCRKIRFTEGNVKMSSYKKKWPVKGFISRCTVIILKNPALHKS